MSVAGNVLHDRIQALKDLERNDFFTDFLQQSGEHCDVVIRTFYQGSTEEGDALWNVSCRNNKSYVILIHNDFVGSTKILDCTEWKAMNGGECFRKF